MYFNSLYNLSIYVVEGVGLHSLSRLGVECCIRAGLSYESLDLFRCRYVDYN